MVRHDKGGIKANTKLANQIAIPAGITRQVFEKFFGARLGNRAQVIDRFFATESDTVIGNGDGACRLI